MEIRSLHELREVDDRSRHAMPGGLGLDQMMTEADTVLVHQERVASPDLVDGVPDATAGAFERVRITFTYGSFDYGLFTVADNLVRLTLELALRERFVAFAGGSLRFLHDTEPSAVHRIDSFDDVLRAVGRGAPQRPKAWRLDEKGVDEQFTGSLPELWAWARENHLLRGQVNRVRERAMLEMRNMAAHPVGSWTMYPADVADTIRHTAELINQLWDCPTPGGRYYPAPLSQRPHVYGWADGHWTTSPADRFAEDVRRFAGMTCAVFAVCDEVHPMEQHCHAHFDLTPLPSRYLHGPATPEATLQWLDDHSPKSALADPLDRRFLLVAGAGQWPLRLETLSLTDRGLADSSFHVITADSPGAAWALACELDSSSRDDARQAPPSEGNESAGDRATLEATGTWVEVQHLFDVDGDAEPVPVFDTSWPPYRR